MFANDRPERDRAARRAMGLISGWIARACTMYWSSNSLVILDSAAGQHGDLARELNRRRVRLQPRI